MVTREIGIGLRQKRHDSGFSQRELARASNIPQPNIAAYESGRRMPSDATLARLNQILGTPTLQRIGASRAEIAKAAIRRGLGNVRVFGSVARGEATRDSDVDLLVHPGPEVSLFDLAGFALEVEEILGTKVDVISDRGTGPIMDRILSEAIAL